VTTSEVTGALAKLLVYGLARYFPAENVYHAPASGKDVKLKTMRNVVSRFGEGCAYTVIGDGDYELEAGKKVMPSQIAGLGLGLGRDGMGRDGIGRDGMRAIINAALAAAGHGRQAHPRADGPQKTHGPPQQQRDIEIGFFVAPGQASALI
jgi:hypothetical protein